MSKSPPMEIKGRDPEANARAQLVYVAEIFKTTMRANALATLEIMGSSGSYIDQISQALEKLQIPRQKIVPIVVSSPFAAMIPPIGYNSPVPTFNGEGSASIYIDYGAGRQRVTVQFKRDENALPIEVEFEVEPDGTMLKEVKVEWATPLKTAVATAGVGVGGVKFATKIVGLAGFDRKTVNNIETELKGKLKQALTVYLKTVGKIEFYGAIGVKYADEKFKPVAEAGVLFEIPFDLADLVPK